LLQSLETLAGSHSAFFRCSGFFLFLSFFPHARDWPYLNWIIRDCKQYQLRPTLSLQTQFQTCWNSFPFFIFKPTRQANNQSKYANLC
jgi:hypothetical protein